MAGASDLVDAQQHGVAVAVEVHAAVMLVLPLVSPLTHSSPRERDQYVALAGSRVCASAPSIQACIRCTAPLVASCTTAATRPSAFRLRAAKDRRSRDGHAGHSSSARRPGLRHGSLVRNGLHCDALLEAGPDGAHPCEGWTTHDLAAHVWVRENDPSGDADASWSARWPTSRRPG